MPDAARRGIRCAAIAGYALSLASIALADSYQFDLHFHRIYALVAGALGVLVLVTLARSGAKSLMRHPDLLVPFGCYLLATWLLDGALVPDTMPSHPRDSALLLFRQRVILDSSIDLLRLAGLVLHVALFAAFLAWLTEWQLAAVAEKPLRWKTPDRSALRSVGRVMEAMGYGLLLFLAVFASCTWIQNRAWIPEILAECTCTALGTALTLLTLLWLPMVLRTRSPCLHAVVFASRDAARSVRLWWALMLAWSLALGVVRWVHVRIRSMSWLGPMPESHFHVDVPSLLGAFPHESAWYPDGVQGTDDPFGLYIALLAPIFIALAIAVKLTLYRTLHEHGVLRS